MSVHRDRDRITQSGVESWAAVARRVGFIAACRRVRGVKRGSIARKVGDIARCVHLAHHVLAGVENIGVAIRIGSHVAWSAESGADGRAAVAGVVAAVTQADHARKGAEPRRIELQLAEHPGAEDSHRLRRVGGVVAYRQRGSDQSRQLGEEVDLDGAGVARRQRGYAQAGARRLALSRTISIEGEGRATDRGYAIGDAGQRRAPGVGQRDERDSQAIDGDRGDAERRGAEADRWRRGRRGLRRQRQQGDTRCKRSKDAHEAAPGALNRKTVTSHNSSPQLR